MDAERYARFSSIAAEALRRAPAERAAYINAACGDDAALRDDVRRVLEDARDDGFTDTRIAAARRRMESGLRAAIGDIAAPASIGGYRIVRRLAAGGMGTVYEAEQAHPRRRVAIKIVHAHIATTTLTERLRREAEILGRLQHPGIAQVFDAGTFDDGEGGRPWFAMEFIEGRPLTAWAAERGLDVRGRLELFTRICDAVGYAHEHGIVHRDLKPDNILVDGRGQPKVLDFGIARITAESTIVDHSMTQTGQIIGTLGYMAPEQLSGAPDAVTVRADVYALGVILYELLAGRLPHAIAGMSLTRALRTICDERPAPLHAQDPALRGDLTTIVEKAIDVEPHRRYDSVGALATDVRRHLESRPILARPTSRIYIARKYVRRNRTFVGGAAATLLVLVAGLVAALVLANQREEQRRRADERALEAHRNLVSATGAILENVVAHLEAGRVYEVPQALQNVPESVRGWSWGLLAQAAPIPLDLTAEERRGGMLLPFDDGHVGWLSLPSRQEFWIVDLLDGSRRHPFAGTGLRHQTYAGNSPRRVAWSATEALLVDVAQETILRRWPHPIDPATGETAVMQNPSMASAGGRVVVLDYTTFCDVRVGDEPPWRLPKAKSTYVVITPDASTLMVNDHRGAVDILDVATRRVLHEIREEGPVTATSLLPFDGGFAYRLAVKDPSDSVTRVYDRVGDEIRRREIDLSPERHSIMSITLDGRRASLGTWFVRSGRDTRVVIRDAHTAAALRSYPVPDTDGVWSMLSSNGGLLTLQPFREPPFALRLDLEHAVTSLLPAVGTSDGYLYGLAVSGDGSLLATASPREGRVRLWDSVTMECVGAVTRRSAEMVNADAVMLFGDGDDRLIATTAMPEVRGIAVVEWSLIDGTASLGATAESGGDHHAPLLDAVIERARPAPRARLSGKAQMLGGEALAICRDPREHRAIHRTARGQSGERWRSVAERHIGDVDTRALAVHPRDELVAVVTAGFAGDHALWIRDAHSGAVSAKLPLPAAPWCVAYSPDGASLAIGDQEGFISIYECAFLTRQLRFRAGDPRENYQYIHALAWLPDGDRLASVSGDRTVRLWDARPWPEQQRTRRAWVALRETMAAREDLAEIYPTLTGAERAAARIELIRRR